MSSSVDDGHINHSDLCVPYIDCIQKMMGMWRMYFVSIMLVLISFSAWPQSKNQVTGILRSLDLPIEGKWVRIGHDGPLSLEFTEGGIVLVDLGDDQAVDIRATYTISGDTISFVDIGGQTCPEAGIYRLYESHFHIAFDVLDDMCGGRIKATAGFWTRPDYQSALDTLAQLIGLSGNPKDYVERARVYLALGESAKARSDLNVYIEFDTTNARVFMNRAATNFPFALDAVINDCTKALTINPGLKNAYFMRGLALYETGHHQKACKDFERAIELGFTILREAEEKRCSEYWDP